MRVNNYSDHFIRFAIKGEDVDFNAFKTREEFDNYKRELKEFLNKSDGEAALIIEDLKKQNLI